MGNAVEIGIVNFSMIYLLLLVVGIVMKINRVDRIKLLTLASVRMTVQLVVAGYILTYMLEKPRPWLVVLYILGMTAFAIYRILSLNKGLNLRFKLAIGFSVSICAIVITIFFIGVVVGQSVFNPQYAIPISGMILGNAMTGASLGVKTFMSKLAGSKLQAEALLNQGAPPKNILLPMVNSSLETALLPTMNSMLGMGIVSLPGMMTGQILSGESPSSAIVYQICIMICIATVVCLAVFLSLSFGYKTLYDKEGRFVEGVF